MPDTNIIQQELAACAVQAEWMRNSVYAWQSNPTIPKSKYKGTCVTYVACVLQRIGILESGQAIWHNKKGQATGINDKMQVFYFNNKNLHEIKSSLQAGDIIMDGSGSDMQAGSHIFIITGNWSGDNPIVWDNHSAQQNLGAYVYRRNRHIICVVRLADTPYIPRLDDEGMEGSPYYYSKNPFYLAGYGLPNCTCYAWGRFWENADINHDFSNRPTLSTGDAEDWFGYTADGYERGQEPRLGAVACWADGPFSGDGHVAIVEEIDPDTGVITCSNSAYGGQYFYITHLSPPNYLPASGYRFQGFIYNPWAGGVPAWYKTKAFIFKRALWHREEDLIK